ncbi:MAG: hypothetical protein HYV27_25265 [Candidatus Hydrogenedentes bacterium]|nr:hypothetical protein [Candidatus Hydrogenedentota bacterium]
MASGAVPGWSIEDWIQFYREGLLPLVVGDAFPCDAVPVPAYFLASAQGPRKMPKTLPWPQWLELCRTGNWPDPFPDPVAMREVERQHVAINRATGTALEGQLRTERGHWPAVGIFFVALIDDILEIQDFTKMLELLCTEGWGYGRSYGYGHIELDSIEPLEQPEPASHFATMGHCHPTECLPEIGWWRWRGVPVRRHNPDTRRAAQLQFTTMLDAGATFECASTVFPSHVGAVLFEPMAENGHYAHNGFAPVWPVSLKEENHG